VPWSVAALLPSWWVTLPLPPKGVTMKFQVVYTMVAYTRKRNFFMRFINANSASEAAGYLLRALPNAIVVGYPQPA